MTTQSLLEHTASEAVRFVEGLQDRALCPRKSVQELRQALGGPLPEAPCEPHKVIDSLIANAEPGLLASTSGRFFGFVIGGALPVALAADWLTSAWDQNAGLYVAGPAASVVEEVSGAWLLDLLGLPPSASFAFVTGCQMAHFTALAAARHQLLLQRGINVETQGLFGAPPIRVIASEERHATVDRALRFLGLGTASLRLLASDSQGRLPLHSLEVELQAEPVPTIVCAQAGNVNTGAFDSLGELCDLAHAKGAWVHVDGAFGMWAAVSPTRRHLVAGCEKADSWAMDAHKWLNVPHDCGLCFVAHPAAHHAALSIHASYLQFSTQAQERDELDWTPEFSRRARGFTVYAALRALGRSGLSRLIDHCCHCAERFVALLSREPAVEVLNEVNLNQVLLRFLDPTDPDRRTREVIDRVQREGVCWVSGTQWKGKAALRISVTNWSTTELDVQRSVDAILGAFERTRQS